MVPPTSFGSFDLLFFLVTVAPPPHLRLCHTASTSFAHVPSDPAHGSDDASTTSPLRHPSSVALPPSNLLYL
jgi:hypothetical protein